MFASKTKVDIKINIPGTAAALKNSRMVHGVSFDFKQFNMKGQIFVKTGKLSAFEY